MHPSPAGAAIDPRAEANRRNAALSTGPKTTEGKRRASLNALRHGLTGQTVVLPGDDLAAYQRHCSQFHAELRPKGLIETREVQTIADTYWRLDRIRALENNLFALATQEQEPLSSDPLISAALAQAHSLDTRSDLLARLSLYEQRLNRTLVQTQAHLKQLQQERAQAESRALKEAEKIRNLKKALKKEWRPEDDGFKFSSRHLDGWVRRRDLVRDAELFHHGELPTPLASKLHLPSSNPR